MSNKDAEKSEIVTIHDVEITVLEEVFITHDGVDEIPEGNTKNDTVPPPKIETDADVNSTCPVCDNRAVKKQNTIKCNGCDRYVHYHCSRLPPYMLYSHERKPTKKFDCEVCVQTPEHFLTKIINENIASSIHDITPTVNPPVVQVVGNEKFADLERKVNEFSELMVKFDLATIANNLLLVGGELTKTQNNLKESMSVMQKMTQQTPTNVGTDNCESAELEKVTKEATSYKHSYELLLQSWEEKEKELLVSLKKDKETATKDLNEQLRRSEETNKQLMLRIDTFNEANQKLHDEVKAKEADSKELFEINVQRSNTISELKNQVLNWETKADNAHIQSEKDIKYLRDRLQSVSTTKVNLEEKVNETTTKYSQTFTELQSCKATKELLVKQLDELKASSTNLEQNLALALNRNVDRSGRHSEDGSEIGERDRVVILHDSLCNDVNDTILSKEDIATRKIWAPDLEAMLKATDEIEEADVIVIEALTRDLPKKSAEEIAVRLKEVVQKAQTKSKKVVISTLLRRSDSKSSQLKGELVNAAIKFNYGMEDDVIVCDNKDISDASLYKPDGIHLRSNGTSWFASNLKSSIAEALGITIKGKKKMAGGNFNNGRSEENEFRRSSRNFFGGGFNRNFAGGSGYNRRRNDSES